MLVHAHHELLKTSSFLLRLLLRNRTCFQTQNLCFNYNNRRKKLDVVINEAHSVILSSMDDHPFISTLSGVEIFFKLIYLDLYWGRGWIDEQVP